SGSELVKAGHSTSFASFTRHTAPNAADPASVIRSMTCDGGIDGARGGCGWSAAETAGGTHTVGRTYLLAGIGDQAGRFALRNVRTCRTASGILSFVSFHGKKVSSDFGASIADSM